MVAVTDNKPGWNGLNESSFIRLLDCLKPFTYIGVGMMLGLVIMNGDREEKLLRGSSLNSIQTKNMSMSELPRVHIDINFPEHQSDQHMGGFLPTVNVLEGGGGVLLDSNVNSLRTQMNQEPQASNAYNSMPAENQINGVAAPTVQTQAQGQIPAQIGFDQTTQVQAGAPPIQNESQMQTNLPIQDAALVQQEQAPPMQHSNLPQQPLVHYGGQMQSLSTIPGAIAESNQIQAKPFPMQDVNLPQQQPIQDGVQSQSLPTETMLVAGSDGSQMHNVEGLDTSSTSTQVSNDGSSPRPIMYTFYDNADKNKKGKHSTGMDDKSNSELLDLWAKHWNNAGWDARILTLEDSKRHPYYDKYLNRLESLPMEGVNGTGANRVYNQLCFLRWLAVAAVGGGFMSDYDLFPLGHGTGDPAVLPSVDLPNNGDFTVYSVVPKSQGAAVPCLMSGRADEWTRLAIKILSSALKMEDEKATHITDMFALIALRFDKIYNTKDDVVNGEYVLLGRDWTSEDCAVTTGKRGVHFSHHAITEGDASYIKKGVIGASDRAGIIEHWAHQWGNECST